MELRHDPEARVRRQLRAQLGAVVRLRSHNRYISRAVMKTDRSAHSPLISAGAYVFQPFPQLKATSKCSNPSVAA